MAVDRTLPGHVAVERTFGLRGPAPQPGARLRRDAAVRRRCSRGLAGRRKSAALATDLVVLWGAAILTFLGGVRRGLSFRTAGGPTAAQIAVTLWLFGLGLAALVLATTWALLLLLAGYASLLVLDPWSARRGEVPLFFERLRPLQMAIPVASLGALLLLEL